MKNLNSFLKSFEKIQYVANELCETIDSNHENYRNLQLELKINNLSHNNQTHDNLNLYQNRLENLDLIWCKQALSIIKNSIDVKRDKKIKINDLGCNYFQLYKEIGKDNDKELFDYFGYEHEKEYIKLGLKKFPELSNRYTIGNIENIKLRNADSSVISATLEHVEQPYSLLNNVLKTTKQIIFLRTYLGDREIVKLQNDKNCVKKPYFVNQFSILKLIDIFLENGFTPKIYKDTATNSELRDIFNDNKIKRKFYIITGIKN